LWRYGVHTGDEPTRINRAGICSPDAAA